MALPSKFYRFKIELSDLEKSVYESLDLRVAQHPSESMNYLLTRVFAYALSFEEGIQFSQLGLADPDSPCLSVIDPVSVNGNDIKVCIEIGNPNERRIHKASKSAKILKIYTYKDPHVLMTEIRNHDIFRKDLIQVYSIKASFLDELEKSVKKDNRWTLIYNDGVMMLNADDFSFEVEILRIQL